MTGIVTVQRMKEIEKASNDAGIDYLRLMENAGSAAAAFICKKADIRGRNCVIVAGKGNNGGDAFVVARKLLEREGNVSVLLADGLPTTDQSKEMLDQLFRLGMEVIPFGPDKEEMSAQKIASADLIVDGIFGTGFHGEIPQEQKPLFAQINQAVAAVFCLDIPSGVCAKDGSAAAGAIHGDFTITFHRVKAGMLFYPARNFLGKLQVVSIGIPEELGLDVLEDGILAEEEDVFAVLPKREADSHKGNYGRLLHVCGSVGFSGAAVLSAMGAARVGTGLLTVAAPSSALLPLMVRLPEAMTLPLEENAQGRLSESAAPRVLQALQNASACLIGCGIGKGDNLSHLLEQMLWSASCPIVLDADGINNLCGRIDILQQAKCPVILTPHMGEMARLLGVTVDELRRNRFEKLKNFTEKYQVIVVLKDSVTTIFEPGGTFFISQTGNAGLAKGGSGDLLAGMIAGFCAQGIAPVKSAVCGVYLHGLAADGCAARMSQYSMLPSDILKDLSQIFTRRGL
ncbi:MAG: NAD(P)H-hydrate dehydratase [Oscillospiraceae bacterium]|nr:NAD(P)H-hydrate dehydratase [Oscillospiraceae bacterium]